MAIGNIGFGNIFTLATISNSPRKILARTVKYRIEVMYALSTEGEAEAWASLAHISQILAHKRRELWYNMRQTTQDFALAALFWLW